MPDRLHLPDRWRRQIEALLVEHVPDAEVWAYGSRADGTSHDASDLDLVLRGPNLEPIPISQLSDLKDALEESNIPILVDFHDWTRLPESFHKEIERQYVVLQDTRLRTMRPGTRGYTLGDVAEIVMGQSPPGSTVASSGETPLLNGPTDFGPDHPYPTQFTSNGKRFAKPGDILFCVRGSTTGRMNWADQPYAIGRGIAAIRHSSEPSLQHLVRAAIELDLPQLLSQATGSTFPNVSSQQLSAVRWPHMGPDDQHMISRILKALDDKSDSNRRISRTLEAIAQALFKSWFIDFDPVRAKMEGRDTGLPDHIADLFPDRLANSSLGLIPEGWNVVRLGDVMELNPRRSAPRGEMATYLEMADMPTETHRPSSVKYRAPGSGVKFINGDTLVARITPCLENGKIAFVSFLSEDEVGWGSTEYVVLRPRPPLPLAYAYLVARTIKFRDFAVGAMTGSSGRQRVSADVLSGFELVKPAPRVAMAFGYIAACLMERASMAVEASSRLKELRDAMIFPLLSDRLRTVQ